MKRQGKLLKALQRRRRAILDAQGRKGGEGAGDETMLLAQIEELERLLSAAEELSAQHELHWRAHGAELRRRLVHDLTYIMIAFDTEDTRKPDRYILNPGVLELLHWWREEGGREEYMGELPLQDRRRLEEMERAWRDKEP